MYGSIMINHSNRLLTIQQVSHKLKIPKSTLRFWERELAETLIPVRSDGGQRRYTEKNLEVISKVKTLKEEGLTLVDIRNYLSTDREFQSSDFSKHAAESLANRIADIVKSEIYKFIQGTD